MHYTFTTYSVFMRHFLILVCFLFSMQVFSQTMTISGNVQDTIAKTPLRNSVAMAIRIKDSVLIAHTRTDENGAFKLSGLPIDTVQVIISNSKFNEQTFYVFGSAKNFEFDFGKVVLPPKSQQLGEVIIYAFKDPVYYKGDTLVYTADSFKVKPNATVEDLLRKLPGIKVDAAGKITSQGKEVSQVLVDGDEFFGSDPTVATKNLAATGVESVQVYEKKNENAADGEEETTQVMNLKLKDEAKKGYFGKVSGASDFQDFHEGELLANRFRNTQKVSVFALASNTPKSTFGWGDMYKYGLDNESNMQEGEDGERYWSQNNDQNQGVPKTLKSGFYFNDKLNKKTKLGVNYTYNNNQLKASSSTRSQFFLADTNYVTDNVNESLQRNETHAINFKLTQTLDSLTELEIEPKFKLNSGKQDNYQITRFLTDDDTLMRQTNVSNSNKASGYNLNAKAKLTRKFKNRDRLFRMNYNITLDDNKSEGLLKSFNSTYDSIPTNDSIDQKKNNAGYSQMHNASVIYTEPLTKKIKLEFDYSFNYTLSNQSKKALNFYNGEYSAYDSTLTNDFENVKMTNRFGVKFIHETKKQSFNVGARIRNVDVSNTNQITDEVFSQSINNVLPFLGYMYRFSQSSRFNFRYTTTSAQPSMNQLQPVPDNTNPNKVTIGNPNLLPTFSNNFNASFNSYKPVSGKYIWMNANYTMTDNAFANSVKYDSVGRAVSQTLNVDGNYNVNGYLGGGIPFFSRALNIQPSVNGNYSSYSSFINSERNTTKNLNMNFGIDLEVDIDTLAFSVGYNYDYNAPSSTLSTASNKPYSEQKFDADFRLKLPWKMLIQTEATYVINSQRAEGYNLNYIVWNASFSKAFLKNENLILAVEGNDLLNQNISNKRTIQDNVITDNKTNIISRYFMLRLTYKFNSTKTKDNEENMW